MILLCLALWSMVGVSSSSELSWQPLRTAADRQQQQQQQRNGMPRPYHRQLDEDDSASSSSAQDDVKEYHLWKSVEIHEQLLEWKTQYPDFLRVTTSQEKYGLPAAGEDADCPFYSEKGCPNYILEIQDFGVHPADSSSSNNLPEVFWSGCLHGNERVGPTAVVEATALLLEAAQCEALPSSISSDHDEQAARDCRKKLKDKGIDNAHRKWLARLVTTRRIVVVPTSNALGYFQNRREEGLVDPNRDFPYDITDSSQCMQTIAGRTLNEIYRDHLFQLAFTFHAGMEVVAYEWGAPTWLNHFSPDDVAQETIASAYSRYGGGWSKSKPYNYGTMNDLVYYVRGGMEDWAYAGSWDSDRVVQCTPKSFGGYPAEKTVYNNSTLRVFNMLVETSNSKEPRKSDLGSSLGIMQRDTKENGHVSRNIRLALLAAELVEPYVSVVGVNELAVQDDLPPLSSREGRHCQKTKAFSIAKDASEVEIQFTVGGALSINDVQIWSAKWDDIPGAQLDCLSQPTSTDGFQLGTIIGATNGTGYFSLAGSHPRPDVHSEVDGMTNGPIFKGRISVPSGLKTLDQLVVLASARVDQDWANDRSNIEPKGGPQSHVVNARTNPHWHHESAGKHVTGRLDWFSSPVTIVIGDFAESVGTHGGDGLVKTVEMNPRFSGGAGNSGLKPKSATEEQLWFPVSMWYVFAGFLALLAFCLCCLMRRQQRRQFKGFAGYSEDDGFTFDSKPYSDVHDDDELDDDDLNDGVELPSLS
jgi:hypothetical protein